MGRHLCKLNDFGVMRKAWGTGNGINKRADGIGLVVVCLGLGREFGARLEVGS